MPRPTGCIEIAMGDEAIENTAAGRVILIRHRGGTYSVAGLYNYGDFPKPQTTYFTRWLPPEVVAAVEAELGGKYTFGDPDAEPLASAHHQVAGIRHLEGVPYVDAETVFRLHRKGDEEALRRLAARRQADVLRVHGESGVESDRALDILHGYMDE